MGVMKTKLIGLFLTVLNLHFAAASRAGEDYVAHEWGTFTSVQGADGVQLEWNPLSVSELPSFVHSRGKSVVAGTKSMATLQRMETPVIYFYSGQERSVDVTVNFPQGIMTEWYPQVRQKPATDPKAPALIGRSVLRWDQVRVLPWAENRALAATLPGDTSGSHYYAARDTDADLLRVLADEPPPRTGTQTQWEKFLFYRGVGSFRAPLTVTLGGDGDEVQLRNAGAEPLSHLFIYTVQQGRGKFLQVDRLDAGESKAVKLADEKQLLPLSELRLRLAAQMQTALVQEGLYAREAAAMVQTWDDSWFAEPGLRVLYTLPRAWTDRILPLALEPAPREVARVMVGRAEMITPPMEWALMKQVVRYSDRDERTRASAVTGARAIGLGRFLEPATRRLMAKMPSAEFAQAASGLLMAAGKPSGEAKPLAAK